MRLALLAALCLTTPLTQATEVRVAVAANFTKPLDEIAAAFKHDTGHTLSFSSASTGKLYAQVVNGAPFEVFLSADDETPARLERAGLGVAGTRFTYATGVLVLWSPDPGKVDVQGKVLDQLGKERIAIANPRLAPYGQAALETLQHLGMAEALKPRFVTGENIGQAYQFVASGNAELGLVAASQVIRNGRVESGSAWVVPEILHSPLHQDAILLRAGSQNAAARALLDYLRTPATQSVLRRYGYR